MPGRPNRRPKSEHQHLIPSPAGGGKHRHAPFLHTNGRGHRPSFRKQIIRWVDSRLSAQPTSGPTHGRRPLGSFTSHQPVELPRGFFDPRSAHVHPHGRGHDPSKTVHVYQDPDKKDARDWPHGQGMVLPYADLSAGSVMTTKEGPKATSDMQLAGFIASGGC